MSVLILYHFALILQLFLAMQLPLFPDISPTMYQLSCLLCLDSKCSKMVREKKKRENSFPYNMIMSLLISISCGCLLQALMLVSNTYYKNLPMQYTEIFLVAKNENFIGKISIYFLFLLKI